MPGKYIVALDAGTTSSRAILVDEHGKIIDKTQNEFSQYFPIPGWVEHDPREIWESQLKAYKELLTSRNLDPTEIHAIGITNQRETVILWDRESGEPVHRAIVWQDRRTADLCEDLKSKGHEATFRDKTGLIVDAYFSGTKIKWILDKHPEIRESAESGNIMFGTVDSWLMYNLSGGKSHVTDITNASRTLLFNIHTQEWDNELLEILEIPPAILPEVLESSGLLAETDPELTGVSIPITGCAGDQQSALFGQLCLNKGMVKNTYGTGCFTILNTGDMAVISKNGLLSTIAWKINGKISYALEGSVFVAGALVQWLRDELKIIEKASDIEDLALSAKDNGGITLIPALSGLAAPYWDPYARGGIFGLTRGSNRAHIARAALEAIALRTMEVVNAMKEDSGVDIRELRVDGGASNNDLLMQIQSDLLEIKVTRPAETESTALGAAYLAGLGSGFWNGIEDLNGLWESERIFEPGTETDREKIIYYWKKGIEASRGWTE